MNLHEYQGKSILKRFGVAVPEGIVAESPEQSVEAAKTLQKQTGTKMWVVKAQIHAGGRGKGGGVKLAKSLTEVEQLTDKIIGMHLVTPQTPPEGKLVRKVLIQQDIYYPGPSEVQEYYMSVLLNRSLGRNMIMYSPRGGMDIEKVAEETPDQIFTEVVDPAVGLQGFQARRIAFNLGLSGKAFKSMVRFAMALNDAYLGSDASLFEINPVVKTSDDQIFAVDCKVSIDNNSLFRHADIAQMRDL
ncbi:MAG: ATP-grasp domain-containing protein, partial [Bacteroidota bacterium]